MTGTDPVVVTTNLALEGTLLPPAAGLCQACAVDHPPDMPHNKQSLYYQYWFYRQSNGSWPTWGDALAHCSPDVQAVWTKALLEKGVTAAQLQPSSTEATT